MARSYTYTPLLWLSFLTVVLLVALAIFGWRRRSVPGAVPFVAGCLFTALWASGSFMEFAVTDVAAKIFWVKFQVIWLLPATTAITCYIVEYAWPGRYLTPRNLILLSIVPLLVLALALTNDLHRLLWSGFLYDGSVLPLRGPAAWIVLIYAYIVGLTNIFLVARLFLHWPLYRWPMALVLVSQVSGRVVYLLDKVYVIRTRLPVDMLGVLFVFLAWAIVMFGFRILDPVPLARKAVIAQMRDGLLVLDAEGRAVSLNPAAQAILGVAENTARGKPVRDLLPMVPDEDGDGLAQETRSIEIRLGVEPQVRHYLLEASALKDARGLTVGHLLLLHDRTERRQAQAQILEQQKALAMLQEREQLARELHDGIGQVLGFVKMQAQAARDQLGRDQVADADGYLAQLVAVAQDAHADVREYILGARTSAAVGPGLLAALQQYMKRFTQQYGLRTDLVGPPDGLDDLLAPTAEAQLLRIIQEALTNARKHAKAEEVRVSMELVAGQLQVKVQDDGVGFDLARLAIAEEQKYGLGFMRERAENVGGSVEIRSAPGAGTQVIISMPRCKEGS